MRETEPDAPPSARVLTIAMVLIAAATLWHGFHPISDLDLWWHMKLGEQLLKTGSLVPTDPFSHTYAGADWPWKDAGFGVLAYLAWSVGGAAAIVIAKAVGFAALAGLLWQMLRHARGLPPALALVGVAVAMDGTAYRFTERAASLSLLLLTTVLLLIERDRQGRNGLWWAIVLIAVGANLHRGVIVLPVVLGAYAATGVIEALLRRESHAAERWPRNALVAVASGAACLATPFGTALLSTSSNLMGEHTQMLTEWAPVSADLVWALSPGSFAVLGIVALATVILVWRERPLAVWDLTLLAMALALGLSSMRQLPYLALLAAGPATQALARWPGWIRRVGGLLAIAAGALFVASGVSRPLAPPSLGLAPHHYPERGIAFVRRLEDGGAELHGNLFNEFGYGGYLIWHLWPEHRVYIDGRTDLVYPPEHVQAYLAALEDPRALAREQQRWDLQWLFLDNAPHVRSRAHLDANPEWALVHVSRRALIYVRTGGENAALAEGAYRLLWAHDLDGSIARAANAGHGQQVVEELRRMVDEDPDNIYAVGALARLGAQLGIDPD